MLPLEGCVLVERTIVLTDFYQTYIVRTGVKVAFLLCKL